MKKKIIAVIAFVLVVTGVPFCAIKGDEAARARAKEAAESQNKEWYKEANACIDAGEYEDAIKLLEKLPTDYEDSRYIIPYAEYCKGVADKEKIEQLYRLTWNFPRENEYTGKYSEKMQTAKAETKAQYEEYDRTERERKKRRNQERMYHIKGWSEKIYGDLSKWQGQQCCRVRAFIFTKRNYSRDDKSMDMYDVYDYDDPEDFYYDHVDEFDDIQDAEDYWEENR